MKQHLTTHRAALALALLAGSACDPPAVLEMPLPDGLPIAELSDAQRALLRATIAVSDGALSETDVTFDVDDLVIRGDFALQNVTSAGDRTMTLRVYGRSAQAPLTDPLTGLKLERAEVLLGAVSTTLAVSPSAESRGSFAGASFESCAPGLDGLCGVLFDENRNRSSNVLDLVAGIDPAPQAPFLEVSPSTLQFPSGISLGQFARQAIVLENRGPHPVQVKSAEVVGGQGVALSVFDPSGLQVTAPRRALSAEELAGPTGAIAPSDEIFLAVSFAPVNLFFTSAAVQVVVEDTVTHVQQTVRTKVLANAQGTLRPPPPDFVPPEVADLALELGTLPVTAFPTAQLFNGLAINGVGTGGGLVHTGALLLSEDAEGAPIALPADLAFAVDIPPRHRFSTSVGDLNADVDVGVFTVDEAGLGALACPTCFSSNSGSSPEAAEFTNESDVPLRVVIVLGRADVAPVVEAIEGALTVAETVSFRCSTTVSRGPEFDDDGVTPNEGPLEGGARITFTGRGFDPRATVTFADSIALDAVITTDDAGRSTVALTVPPGSLEVGKNPATIVVANPAPEDDGDGQAATLAAGFTYQPPAPRLTRVAPSLATTTGPGLPVTVDGSLFSSRFGAPFVAFGDILVEATFVSSTQLIVTAPSLPADQQDAPRTVALTVANRLKSPDGAPADQVRLGAPSNGADFRFLVPVGAPPTVASLSPVTGTTDGGTTVTIDGTGFRAGATVFIGGLAADTGAIDNGGARVTATSPAREQNGPADVVVINDDGQSATLAGAFTYTSPAPNIASVFPSRAVISGGTLLVVAGTGFRDGAQASFTVEGTAVPAANVTRIASTTLLVTTPLFAAAGTATIAIENADGQQASFAGFEIFEAAGPPPTVRSIEPTAGGAAGGYLITLLGTGFITPTVLFGGTLLSGNDLDVVTAAAGSNGIDRISFTAPASATGLGGAVAVQVINGDKQSDGTSFSYEVAAPASPRVDRVVPGHISGTAITPIVVFGANLADTVEVLAGGVSIPFVVASSFEVSATLPPSAPGVLMITVVTAAGDNGSFPVIVVGPPSLEALSNTVVHASVSGDQLALFGEGLDAEDLAIDVRTTAQGAVDLPAHVLVASAGFMLVELPRLPAEDGMRLVVSAAGADQSASVESPPFSARAPFVSFSAVSDIVQNGTLTFTALGSSLNPVRLGSIILVDLSGAGRNVSCALQSASEGSLECRTTIAAFPDREYGIALAYNETFAGGVSPLDIVVTDATGLPQRVFVPDVGQLAQCGDEFVRPNEDCDDGNLDNTDTCTNGCTQAACGDTFVQAGESCDDGNQNDNDACSNDCVLASCGDGSLQAGESCDDGNTINTDVCTSACTPAICGDSFVQAGEGCDDGNAVDEDGCDTACELGVCGDALVQLGEGCDDGNLDDTDDCRNDCALASCGDALLQIGEECDDGNFNDVDACTNTCRAAACGDGNLQDGEECDDNNLDDSDDCTNACQAARCGDAAVHLSEECDDGNDIDTDACTIACVAARCGDALTQLAEECDDGNAVDADLCTTACENARCGDTFVQFGESCDDGNLNDADACRRDCVLASCGNALTQVGEDCDDGNLVDNDACSNACRVPVCGDAILHIGEQCDDGNASSTDGCTITCTLPICGDRFVQAGEGCDDGNAVNTDACTNACFRAACGDGFVQPGEQCDDADAIDGDECSNTCTLPRCGDIIVQAGEDCDDGDLLDFDECTNGCRLPAGLALDPPFRDFGDVAPGQTSASATFTVTNTGGAASGLLRAVLDGADANHFVVAGNTCEAAFLAADSFCAVTIRFAPTTRGNKAVNLLVSGVPGGTTFATLSGRGSFPASLVMNPAANDFGAVAVNAASAPTTFVVTNTGDEASGPVNAAITGTGASEFTIDAGSCTGPLPAAGNCNLTIRFAPTSATAALATLVVSGTPGGTASAALRGTGQNAAGLLVSPATQSFGSIVVTTVSAPTAFTVNNLGSTLSGPVNVVLTGVDASQFIISNNTCTALAAAATCAFNVLFAPTTLGNKIADLSVSATPGGNAVSALAGTSVSAGSVTLNPPSADFGNIAVNTSSGLTTFTVQNTSAATTGSLSVVLSGIDASQFAVTANACATLAAGASCTFAVHFVPTTEGGKGASVSVNANPGGSATANLIGVGAPPSGTCGDTFCVAPETSASCPADCGPPPSCNLAGFTNVAGGGVITISNAKLDPDASNRAACTAVNDAFVATFNIAGGFTADFSGNEVQWTVVGGAPQFCLAPPGVVGGVVGCPLCFGAPPTDMGIQFEDDTGALSNATCVAPPSPPPPICDNDSICDIGVGETPDSCPLDCVCGDTFCQAPETSATCPSDCTAPPSCNFNAICEPGLGETSANCTKDCGPPPSCNNNSVCEPGSGEAPGNCAADCVCGDSICQFPEEFANCSLDCPPPPACDNDSVCEPGFGEDPSNCATDCVCGDAICQFPEDGTTCAVDCGPPPTCNNNAACEPGFGEDPVTCSTDCVCGDTFCQAPEDGTSCPSDCGPPPSCNNNTVCEPGFSEDPVTCPFDCFCGDAFCQTPEDGTSCPGDCGPPPPVCGNLVCEPPEDFMTCPADCV